MGKLVRSASVMMLCPHDITITQLMSLWLPCGTETWVEIFFVFGRQLRHDEPGPIIIALDMKRVSCTR